MFLRMPKKGKKVEREASPIVYSTVSIHLSPNVTVGHLSIFSKARKCPSFHTVLGSLRIDPKKVINLLMPSFIDVSLLTKVKI